jgi:hypothetical protein
MSVGGTVAICWRLCGAVQYAIAVHDAETGKHVGCMEAAYIVRLKLVCDNKQGDTYIRDVRILHVSDDVLLHDILYEGSALRYTTPIEEATYWTEQ